LNFGEVNIVFALRQGISIYRDGLNLKYSWFCINGCGWSFQGYFQKRKVMNKANHGGQELTGSNVFFHQHTDYAPIHFWWTMHLNIQ